MLKIPFVLFVILITACTTDSNQSLEHSSTVPSEFIKAVCINNPPDFAWNSYPQSVKKCGEYYSVSEPFNVVGGASTIIDSTGNVIAKCSIANTPPGYVPNPICQNLTCDDQNLCKGIIADDCDRLMAGTESCQFANAVRSGNISWCNSIVVPALREQCQNAVLVS